MFRKLRKYLRFLIPYEMIVFKELRNANSEILRLTNDGYYATLRYCDGEWVVRYK